MLLGNFKRSHAIALKPERQWQMTRWKRLIVISALRRSRAVHGPTSVEDVLEVSSFRNVFRALEHHVFEKVCEPCSSHLFITRTDIVIKSHRHDWHGVVFAQDYPKTVGKIELLEGGW